MAVILFYPSVHTRAAMAPNLGVAAGYAVFGKAGVTNTTPVTHIWGNVGADLTASITGLTAGPGGEVDGVIDTGAGVEAATLSAYAALDAEPATASLNLSGVQTVGPGVYTVGASTLNGNLTLSGAGVYIFRSSSSVTADPGAQVTLINGASACDVYWQIPASMTIGSGAHVEGTIIADTQLISLGTGASLKGRALSRTAAVTLDSNQITQPTCAPLLPVLPTLTVTKIVVGGTKVVSDFPLFIDNVAVVSGVSSTTSLGLHTISETSDTTYTSSISGDCAINGSITLNAADVKSCIITNTFVPPAAPLQTGGHRRTEVIVVTSTSTPQIGQVLGASTSTISVVSNTPAPQVGQVLGASSYYSPSLPNAGFPPRKNISLNLFVLLSSIFTIIGTFVMVNRNKKLS